MSISARPSLLKRLIFGMLGSALSDAVGYLVRCRLPRWLHTAVLTRFVDVYHVDLTHVSHPLETYATIDAFFTRDLVAGSRPVDPGQQTIVSPVDGRVHNSGDIHAGTLLQAKGVSYRVASLLASAEQADMFQDGSYVTLYLAPKDVHHVYAPRGGFVTSATHVPGRLFPVREPFASGLPGLYAHNERIVTFIQADDILVAVVMVGALNVGHMTLAFDTERSFTRRALTRRTYGETTTLQRADKLGTFHLGSTVVLLTSKRVTWRPDVDGQSVQYGQALGHLVSQGV